MGEIIEDCLSSAQLQTNKGARFAKGNSRCGMAFQMKLFGSGGRKIGKAAVALFVNLAYDAYLFQKPALLTHLFLMVNQIHSLLHCPRVIILIKLLLRSQPHNLRNLIRQTHKLKDPTINVIPRDE
jgi:hypothetical protein